MQSSAGDPVAFSSAGLLVHVLVEACASTVAAAEGLASTVGEREAARCRLMHSVPTTYGRALREALGSVSGGPRGGSGSKHTLGPLVTVSFDEILHGVVSGDVRVLLASAVPAYYRNIPVTSQGMQFRRAETNTPHETCEFATGYGAQPGYPDASFDIAVNVVRRASPSSTVHPWDDGARLSRRRGPGRESERR